MMLATVKYLLYKYYVTVKYFDLVYDTIICVLCSSGHLSEKQIMRRKIECMRMRQAEKEREEQKRREREEKEAKEKALQL